MKNLMMMMIAGIFLFTINMNAAPATKKVTAYTCPGDTGRCLTFKGSGDIWITIPGTLTIITIEVPAGGLVPNPGPGGVEIDKFFLFNNPPSITTGKGYINGCMHYYGEGEEFRVYEIDAQIIYEDYHQWEINAQ